MKKEKVYPITLASLLFICAVVPADAQRFEIVPSAGYETSAKIKAYEGYFRISDGFSYGGSVSLALSEGYRIEVSYSRMGSSMTYTLDNTTDLLCDLTTTYISLGGVVEINPGNPVVPFARIGIGGTYYTPVNSDLESENVMHFSFSGGTRFMLNDHFGFRLQASLLLPIFFEGMVFEEAAPQSGEGMKTKIGGIQGDFTAGVVLRF